MTTLKTSTKLSCAKKDDGCDSNKTDSGFLSGANLMSEENISCENLPSSALQSINFVEEIKKKENISSILGDSGVDVNLNEQFSGLVLETQACVKNQFTFSQYNITNASNNTLCAIKPIENKLNKSIVTQPWELYFQQDEEGDTQLHIAIIQGFIEVVYSLIKMVPHPSFLDILNDFVQSPLHLAILTHQPQIVRWLVMAGASIKIRDRHGNTPLHLACQMGDLKCVKSLTDPLSVSEINNNNMLHSSYSPLILQDFEDRNYEGETCLHLAAQGNHLEILRYLIWLGANINARENKSGQTILHYAVETLNYKLLQFLLHDCSYGSNGLLLDTKNYAGHTAYQLACILDIKIARELINKGAHIGVDDIEDDDHPDHNSIDDEETVDFVHFDSGDLQLNKQALSV